MASHSTLEKRKGVRMVRKKAWSGSTTEGNVPAESEVDEAADERKGKQTRCQGGPVGNPWKKERNLHSE